MSRFQLDDDPDEDIDEDDDDPDDQGNDEDEDDDDEEEEDVETWQVTGTRSVALAGRPTRADARAVGS